MSKLANISIGIKVDKAAANDAARKKVVTAVRSRIRKAKKSTRAQTVA